MSRATKEKQTETHVASDGTRYEIPASPNGAYVSLKTGNSYSLPYRKSMAPRGAYWQLEYDWVLESIAAGEIVPVHLYCKKRT